MVALAITLLAGAIWIYLLGVRGQFWRVEPLLLCSAATAQEAAGPESGTVLPTIAIVVPARNEAALLPTTLTSLLQQTYPGDVHLYLVDDHSTDGTRAIATQIAQDLGQTDHLTVVAGKPLPAGWTGKLWALEQGYQRALQGQGPDYLLLTDADIQHPPDNLERLVRQAGTGGLDLVSLMVRLRCQGGWEKFLIPAFVFFFAKLYPFGWVNDPARPMAAAAGGCSLVRRNALEQIGGLAALKAALIDDCTLAYKIKHRDPHAAGYHPIWLGFSSDTLSLRPYPTLASIWTMVARTAYTQLHYSPLLLVGTVVGIGVVYWAAPIGLIQSVMSHHWDRAALNLLTYGMMTAAYWPMIRFYGCPAYYAAGLPLIAVLYTLMTLDSARRHWQGQGGHWKGRTYS